VWRVQIVSAEEAQAMFPPMSTRGVEAAAFLPGDGYLDPSQLSFALADGRSGARRSDRAAHQGR
jgi:glycine/D-amino acid oxidase-like deaminating enzyme